MRVQHYLISIVHNLITLMYKRKPFLSFMKNFPYFLWIFFEGKYTRYYNFNVNVSSKLLGDHQLPTCLDLQSPNKTHNNLPWKSPLNNYDYKFPFTTTVKPKGNPPN